MSLKMDALNNNLDFQIEGKTEAYNYLAVFVWFININSLGQQFKIPGAKLAEKSLRIRQNFH